MTDSIRMSRSLLYIHREVRDLFRRAGCRTQAECQALAEELVGEGPYNIPTTVRLLELLAQAVDEPHQETP